MVDTYHHRDDSLIAKPCYYCAKPIRSDEDSFTEDEKDAVFALLSLSERPVNFFEFHYRLPTPPPARRPRPQLKGPRSLYGVLSKWGCTKLRSALNAKRDEKEKKVAVLRVKEEAPAAVVEKESRCRNQSPSVTTITKPEKRKETEDGLEVSSGGKRLKISAPPLQQSSQLGEADEMLVGVPTFGLQDQQNLTLLQQQPSVVSDDRTAVALLAEEEVSQRNSTTSLMERHSGDNLRRPLGINLNLPPPPEITSVVEEVRQLWPSSNLQDADRRIYRQAAALARYRRRAIRMFRASGGNRAFLSSPSPVSNHQIKH